MSSILLQIQSEFIGNWTSSLTTLCYFMFLDIVLGLMTATLSKNSTKSESGKLSSKALCKGLMKKGGIFLVILISHRIDVEIKQVIPTFSSVRIFVIWFFIVDEGLSIVENLSLLGVRVPSKVVNILDILHEKLNEESDNNNIKALDIDDLSSNGDNSKEG